MLADFQIEDVVETSPSYVAHKAYSNSSGRKCLLKKYAATEVANAGWKDKFKYFLQEYVQINVPHLRAIVDGGIDNKDGSPFAVFEWSNSPTVTKLLQEQRAFELKEIKEMAVTILEAVSFIHEKELVHASLTPDSVLLNEADKMQPWVLECDPLQSVKSAYGVHRKGYEFFLSPEVLAGSKPTVQSDLFAVGKIVEAVAGENPLDIKFSEWTQKVQSGTEGGFESAAEALKSLKSLNEALIAPAQARPVNMPVKAAPVQGKPKLSKPKPVAKPKVSKPGKTNKPVVQAKPTLGEAPQASLKSPSKKIDTKLIGIIGGAVLGLLILLMGGCFLASKKSNSGAEKAPVSSESKKVTKKVKPVTAKLDVTQVNGADQYLGKIIQVTGTPQEVQYASGPNAYNFFFVKSREDRPHTIQVVIDNQAAFSEATKNEERLSKMRADFLGKEVVAIGELTKNRYDIFNLKVDDFDISLAK